MRDVTDNVTVDLPGMEQRRGRGRPRKAHAMTNAERQAAYRARRKAQQPVDRSVTVTKMLADVDAYDECRLEVDQLREQLDEVRREKEIAWRVMCEQRDKAEELGRELFQMKKRLLQEKSVTPSNGNLTEIEALRRQLMTCEDGRQEALRYAGALKERLAKFELQQKSVTSSNENKELVVTPVTKATVTKKPATKVCTLEEWPFPGDPETRPKRA
ncbi:DNA-binding protein [Ralstonia pseudosolanacearum]|uniref:DNA-binding protein n=1 Tax=Ralstonia pseudosolanacearum TaxID=1310165 RepID=UPI001CB99BDE|nr:DNA-binding protein [Ralstonia pseudosolanacearum]